MPCMLYTLCVLTLPAPLALSPVAPPNSLRQSRLNETVMSHTGGGAGGEGGEGSEGGEGGSEGGEGGEDGVGGAEGGAGSSR